MLSDRHYSEEGRIDLKEWMKELHFINKFSVVFDHSNVSDFFNIE